jgi:predicted CxxxxCH...CXXCH cytochrome family protein
MTAKLRTTKVRYTEDPPSKPRVTATWQHTGINFVGGCNGCHARGRVAVIQTGTFEVRFCAVCLNTINEQLGAFR